MNSFENQLTIFFYRPIIVITVTVITVTVTVIIFVFFESEIISNRIRVDPPFHLFDPYGYGLARGE